jgi:serine protease inhibitor
VPTSGVRGKVAHTHLAFCAAVQNALVVRAAGSSLCWSPFSVAGALGLLGAGASGATRDELLHVLLGDAHGELDGHAAMLREAAALEPAAANVAAPTLAVSDTLWVNKGLPIEPAFAAEVSRVPGGEVRDASFATDPEGARRLINTTVRDTTEGLIEELVPPAAVGQETVAALVTALYLRTAWRSQFTETRTGRLPFHGSTGTRNVPTMRQTAMLGYVAEDGWQVVSIPAAGGIEAVVLLPDSEPGTVDSTVDAQRLARLLDAQSPTRVELFLPRFSVRFSASLASTLDRLGARRMFRHDAELSGISTAPLTVFDVLHESVLRVDEHGLEGAAATAVTVTLSAMVREQPATVVRVDRPFLFLVRHPASGAVYFLARVLHP